MADFFLQNFKQSFTLSDIEQHMELFNDQFPGLNPSHVDIPSPSLNFHTNLMGGTFHPHHHDNFFPSAQLPENVNLANNTTTFPAAGLFIHDDEPRLTNEISNKNDCKDMKRKAITDQISSSLAECSSANCSSANQSSDNGIINSNRKKAKKGKKVMIVEEDETPKDVVHVRARRGQATDSHSLAERVRRGKINERLRCLQDIVPGCYKTMGMAVMLDEIINYVQSLQNQVEFLSTRLTDASTLYDFNDIDAIEMIQRAKGLEAMKIENVGSQGIPSAQFGPLDLNFGFYPNHHQLPHNR